MVKYIKPNKKIPDKITKTVNQGIRKLSNLQQVKLEEEDRRLIYRSLGYE